jgi:23S rRNA pseudouridine2605 synthase
MNAPKALNPISDSENSATTRIQKIISDAGLASRREAEKLIQDGLVTVNGKVVKLGAKADLETDHIKVNGKLIQNKTRKIYIALFKPKGVIASEKPLGENQNQLGGTIWAFLEKVKGRVRPVGTLDSDSEGLLLITNDGDLRSKILNPKTRISRTYSVKIDGHLDEKKKRRLENGVWVESHKIRVSEVSFSRETEGKQWVRVSLTNPQNRIIRKLFESVGHPVDKVRRESIGPVSLRGLDRGLWRFLTGPEIDALRTQAELAPVEPHLRVAATPKTPKSRFEKSLDSVDLGLRPRRVLKKRHKSTKEW